MLVALRLEVSEGSLVVKRGMLSVPLYWSAMTSATTYWPNGVWGSSDEDVFAVGYGGTILHYDGTAWSAMTSGITDWLRGVWGTSSSDVFAVGLNDAILRYSAYVIPIITPFVTPPTFVSSPTITTFSSGEGTQGQTMDVTVSGTNFTGANAVGFGSGITVNSLTVDSDTQITANVTISGSAVLNTRDVSVTTLGGTGTKIAGFTVVESLAKSQKGQPIWVWIATGIGAVVVLGLGAVLLRRGTRRQAQLFPALARRFSTPHYPAFACLFKTSQDWFCSAMSPKEAEVWPKRVLCLVFWLQ